MPDEKLVLLFLRNLPSNGGEAIRKLLDFGILSEADIKRYLIKKEYLDRKATCRPLALYADLAVKYGYSISHIRYLLTH